MYNQQGSIIRRRKFGKLQPPPAQPGSPTGSLVSLCLRLTGCSAKAPVLNWNFIFQKEGFRPLTANPEILALGSCNANGPFPCRCRQLAAGGGGSFGILPRTNRARPPIY